MCPKSSKSKIEKKEPLGELANKVGRNPEIVKVLLSSMSVKDQLKVRFQLSTQLQAKFQCSWVSKTWRKEVQLSCSAVSSFKQELEKNYELRQIDKENAPNFSKKEVTLETSGSVLSPVAKTPKKKVEEVLTPVDNNLVRKAPSTPKKIRNSTLSPGKKSLIEINKDSSEFSVANASEQAISKQGERSDGNRSSKTSSRRRFYQQMSFLLSSLQKNSARKEKQRQDFSFRTTSNIQYFRNLLQQ